MENSITDEKIVQQHADRAFFIIANEGYQHPMNLEKFCNGIRIVHGERYTPLYESELKSLLVEFDNAILEHAGLGLYDD
jgi:hypothetical protein